jgi:hypothetical protein
MGYFLLTSVFLLISIMVTGAFFSRPVGTFLAGLGMLTAGPALWISIDRWVDGDYLFIWWVVSGILFLVHGLLFIAALGGEE